MKTSWDKSFNAFFFPAHLGLCLRASPFVSRPFGGGEEEEKEERRGEKSVVFALGSSYTLFRSMTVAILGIEASLASLSPLPPIQRKVSVDCLFGIRALLCPFTLL